MGVAQTALTLLLPFALSSLADQLCLLAAGSGAIVATERPGARHVGQEGDAQGWEGAPSSGESPRRAPRLYALRVFMPSGCSR